MAPEEVGPVCRKNPEHGAKAKVNNRSRTSGRTWACRACSAEAAARKPKADPEVTKAKQRAAAKARWAQRHADGTAGASEEKRLKVRMTALNTAADRKGLVGEERAAYMAEKLAVP